MKNFVKSKEFQDIIQAVSGEANSWTPISTCNFIFKMFTRYLGAVIDCFKTLAGNSSTATTFFAGFDYQQIAQDLYPISRMIAYSLIVLLVGVNAIESAFQYELMTLRGGIKIAVRLIFAKVFVDLSLDICKGIVSIGTSWLNEILNVKKE